MRFKLRDDVILENVAGEYVLVALRSAWNEVSFVRSVPQKHVRLFRCLEEGLDDEEMLDRIDPDRSSKMAQTLKIYHAIRDGKLYHGYFQEVTE